MRYPKLRELKEAIKALFKGPYTVRFPFKPHIPFERFRGRPYFHEEDCTGCAACVQVCPTGALSFKDEIVGGKAKRKLSVQWDVCIFCGQCQANCLTDKGIILSREFDFATTESREAWRQDIEKELLLCDCCSEPVLPRDQYKWVTEKLGALSFANSSLIVFYLEKLGFTFKEKAASKKEADFLRQERMRILCPRCRREAVIKS
jgi:hydrogenase-4 component H